MLHKLLELLAAHLRCRVANLNSASLMAACLATERLPFG
jgi:hypothetical protein